MLYDNPKILKVTIIALVLAFICYIVLNQDGTLVPLINHLIPHIVYGLILLILVLLIPNSAHKAINDLIEYIKNRDIDFDSKLTIFKQNEKSEAVVTRISASRNNFIKKYPELEDLWDSFIEDRVREIEDGSDGKIEFLSEVQREAFIEKLFQHLRAIPELKLIQSLTWDQDSYFPEYWRPFRKLGRLEHRNDKAKEINVKIERLFIFRKSSINKEKIDIYHDLFKQNSLTSNTEMKWIYEEDLTKEDLEQFKKERSSFLLLINKNDIVRVLTKNFQLENSDEEKRGIAEFYEVHKMTLSLQERFSLLYNQGRSDQPSLDSLK